MTIEQALKLSDEFHKIETDKLREVIEIQSSKLAKAREALEHIAQTTKAECCDKFYWSDDKIAHEALKEIE